MKKVIFALSLVMLTLTSCGTKKKIAALEAQNKECQDLLNSTLSEQVPSFETSP